MEDTIIDLQERCGSEGGSGEGKMLGERKRMENGLCS